MEAKNLLQDVKFKEMIQCLKDRFNPTKIFIFGSRARGDHREDSDYDIFLLVKSSNLSGIDRMKEAEGALWGKVWLPADIFIYTEAEFDEWKDTPGTIAETVATEGVELDVA